MALSDPISRLQQVTFDGLPEVPCQAVGLEFEHSLPVRSYPYINGDGHDWTGRRSMQMQVKLLFLNTLSLEQPGIILFPDVFNQWFERLLIGEAGNLSHPIYGNRRARVAKGQAPLTSEVRGGIIVDVTFVESLDSPEDQIPFNGPETSVAASSLATQNAADAVGVDYPDGKLGALDLVSAVKSVLGQLDSLERQVDGRIAQVQSATVGILQQAESLQDHAVYGVIDNALVLWYGLQKLRERAPVNLQRAVGNAVAVSDTTLDRIARERGNELKDIMNLNPELLTDPTVRRGTKYKYYTGKLSADAQFQRS
jgi:prophage DNA circulation protein